MRTRLPIVVVVIGMICTVRLVWIGFNTMNASNGQVMTPDEIKSIMEIQTEKDKEALDQMWKNRKSKSL